MSLLEPNDNHKKQWRFIKSNKESKFDEKLRLSAVAFSLNGWKLSSLDGAEKTEKSLWFLFSFLAADFMYKHPSGHEHEDSEILSQITIWFDPSNQRPNCLVFWSRFVNFSSVYSFDQMKIKNWTTRRIAREEKFSNLKLAEIQKRKKYQKNNEKCSARERKYRGNPSVVHHFSELNILQQN